MSVTSVSSRMLRVALVSLALAAATAGCTARGSVVYLVRHAEKADDSRDAPLSEVGRERARRLAELLADSGIERVFSTDFARTRDTARPTADALGLEVELYDDVERLARDLRASGERALVVGHSNTTPALVELLGGEAGGPIDESEYDRVYIVARGASAGSGSAETILLRLGLPDAEP